MRSSAKNELPMDTTTQKGVTLTYVRNKSKVEKPDAKLYFNRVTYGNKH